MRHSFKMALSIALLVSITFGAGYWIGNRDHQPVTAQEGDDREVLFAPFWETWDLLHQNYVDELDDRALMEASLNGMIAALEDPHMGYMTPEDYQSILDSLNGEYEGIGAIVSKDETTGALTIVRPFPDSPAEQAGILPGDEVVTVDGEDISELDENVIISMVKGPAGTDVVLGIQRQGEDEVLQITVTRDRIVQPSVEYEILEGNIGYLQLYQFAPNTNIEVHEALMEMDANNLNGLIVDLRYNPGGYLDVTLDIISEFITEGPILIERGADGSEIINEAQGDAVAGDVPLVVLVNEGSASASELMAGAIQDRGRGTIVGVPTFGKGSVQTWRRLSNGGGVRITIERWFTPSGYTVEPDGIQPDVIVEFPTLDAGTPYSQEIDTQLQAAIEELISQVSPRA
jgi:carboxyl-terminal processing protease